jgi:hypothetical protein
MKGDTHYTVIQKRGVIIDCDITILYQFYHYHYDYKYVLLAVVELDVVNRISSPSIASKKKRACAMNVEY